MNEINLVLGSDHDDVAMYCWHRRCELFLFTMLKTSVITQIALAILLVAPVVVVAQHSKSQLSLDLEDKHEQWATKYGHQIDLPFSGPQSFAHLTYTRCLDDVNHLEPFDIAILGMPFDTAVSYRSGARFGPHAIRSGSRRLRDPHGYTLSWGMDPYEYGTRIMDCGDVSGLIFFLPGRLLCYTRSLQVPSTMRLQ